MIRADPTSSTWTLGTLSVRPRTPPHATVGTPDLMRESRSGSDSCEDTKAVQNNLDSLGVQYQYIDVEKNRQAQDWVKQQNGGKQKTPTLDIQGQVLVEPDERQLEEALRGKGLMA